VRPGTSSSESARATVRETSGVAGAQHARLAQGRRPVFGDSALLQDDPAWRDLICFSDYFHGDTGAGLGASHQTGWTGLVANLILARRG
jgi:hypothetical protein